MNSKSSSVKIIPCLDMHEGRVVKGVNFINLIDAGDPVSCACAYSEQGADELVFLDISASFQRRKTMLSVFRAVAESVDIPVTLGGGIKSLGDIDSALEAGASKISIGSAAAENTQFIEEAAIRFGQDKITVALDADVSEKMPSGYEIYIEGGRKPAGIDALDFVREAQDRGAGTLLPTSKKTDGTRSGYDIKLLKNISFQVEIPVIASGGAGELKHFLEAVRQGNASALLAASVFHFGQINIPELKRYLSENGIKVL